MKNHRNYRRCRRVGTSIALIVASFLSLFLFPGCGSTMLLEKDFVTKISAPAASESNVIYCTDDFTAAPDGKILEKKYVVIRVGSNAASFPRVLTEDENASSTILDIEGRIIHADGSDVRITPKAFYRENLSNEQVIAEQYARIASIPVKLTPGDLVELVCLVEHSFPPLGIFFSPAGLDYPSANVTCSIETLPGQDIQYQVVNENVKPTIQSTQTGGKKYVFSWPPYHPPSKSSSVMAQRNAWPALFAVSGSQSWISFGDWYLGLIGQKLTASKALADTAARVVAGKATPKEKMDAIFDYCQGCVRYDQMYVANGEFVPNAADVIFQRRFGDCKDYATLMHAMAASVGVPTDLVLCYRGRGIKFYESTPASQFNHVILHFSDNGLDRWYDATDRLGLYGIPSFDLANARALIIEKGRSRVATIAESPENLMGVTGSLKVTKDGGLSGDLSLAFSHQFAVEFAWEQEHLNSDKMRSSLLKSIKNLLNDDLLIDSLAWNATRESFAVHVRCSIPNCLTMLGEKTYVKPSQLFPNILPDELKDEELQKAFYFPYFNRVSMDLNVTAAGAEPLRIQQQYQLPAGPFDDISRPAFTAQLTKVLADFTRSFNLKGIAHP